jgi:outer membrane protein OmpA-like peptidoglycan-associated protein
VRQLFVVVFVMLGLAACDTLRQGSAPPQTMVVFFKENSADLDADARTVLGRAVTLAQDQPKAAVHVHGFASQDQGAAAYNKSLSQTRADVVVDNLVSAGVARERIVIEPEGETPYELTPLESRRVEITVGP